MAFSFLLICAKKKLGSRLLTMPEGGSRRGAGGWAGRRWRAAARCRSSCTPPGTRAGPGAGALRSPGAAPGRLQRDQVSAVSRVSSVSCVTCGSGMCQLCHVSRVSFVTCHLSAVSHVARVSCVTCQLCHVRHVSYRRCPAGEARGYTAAGAGQNTPSWRSACGSSSA